MPKLSLLMVVTPPDIPITRYTIPALRHLIEVDDVEVIIYMNSLNPDQESEVKYFARELKNCKIKSNRKHIGHARKSLLPGEMYITETGRYDILLGPFEGCGEVWERELIILNSDLVGIIDADLEIFNGGFLKEITESFDADSRLGFMALDYSQTEKKFDTYSNRTCIVYERYHTWFCIYSRIALQYYSNFCYIEEEREGNIIIFDHSSKLQMVLKKSGYHGNVVKPIWGNAFLHYGSFSQNRSLKGKILFVYRILRIGIHNGWLHRHRQAWLVPFVKKASELLFNLLKLRYYTQERWFYR